MKFASIEIGNYKIYYNEIKREFEIYNVYGKKITTCKNFDTAKDYVNLLIDGKDCDVSEMEIMEEVKRLNNIVEPQRTPANRSSILHTRLAEETRKLLGKEK